MRKVTEKMNILGIDFVPLNVPLKNHLEALAAGMWFAAFVGLAPFGILTTFYLLFYTQLWPIICVYLFWIWVIDKDISENGGRPSEWVRSWTIFKYVANYFPITVKAVPGFKLDPKHNYLSCVFPHGFIPIGPAIAFLTYGCETKNPLFPNHSIRGTTFKSNFLIPIFREYLLAIGGCSTTPDSLNSILSHPNGKRIAALFVGGASEAYFCDGGQYRLILKNRKGFVKVALKNGSPIIPCFAFGQTSNYKQIVFQKGSLLQRLQGSFKKVTGIALPVIYGRGLFQYSFGWIPLQNPINIVVGAPIDVLMTVDPSQKDIDDLHQKFIKKLSELFEQYKYEYEENPEKCTLIIS